MLCVPCETIFRTPHFSRYRSQKFVKTTPGEPDFRIHHASYVSFEEALRLNCAFCARLRKLHEQKNRFFRKDGTLNPEFDLSTFSMTYRLAFESSRKTILTFVSRFHANARLHQHGNRVVQTLFLAEGRCSPYPGMDDSH